jgi:molecular chaperone GrpE
MSKRNKSQNDEPPIDQPEDDAADDTVDEPADLQTQRDDLESRLQRTMADYANFQKRAQRETDDARHFARAEVIKSLLPVLDDMERALEAARDNHGEDNPLFQGMQLVHDKALEALGKFGLTVIKAEGRPFDPDHHSALMQQPTTDHPPQTVLQDLQKGYTLNGRTIRPSSVIVAVEPPEETDSTDEADGSAASEDDES